MQRSSESIGTIAAALARAQLELTNPEKLLVATIRPPSPRDAERTFRYASLSSGLDIVRKSLGKQEIATVQTTTIDKEARLVRLTTILAHSSGEWMSSEWPVCPISETASPQRMGTALTYARRYALFTLVGIAGEDDFDAPDLSKAPGTNKTIENTMATGTWHNASATPHEPERAKTRGLLRAVLLDPQQSAVLSEKLLTEVSVLESADQATTWATAALKHKNSLTAAHAKQVEDAFEHRLLVIQPLVTTTSQVAIPTAPQEEAAPPVNDPDLTTGIDKSVLTLGTPRRYRNRKHLRFVAEQPCLLCGRQPSDAHHLRFAQPRALGRKSSDEFTVPLCRAHHSAVHRVGDERAWWKAAGIDPTPIAGELWSHTRQGRRGTLESEPANTGSTPSSSKANSPAPAAITPEPMAPTKAHERSSQLE